MIYPAPAPDWLANTASWAASFPGGEVAFTTVLFLVVLSVLVFIHELGHYLAARSVGVKVEAFSIGFGRPLLKATDAHQTEWRLGWIPLGGYVQLLGQSDLSASKPSRQKGHYMSKRVWQRAWIVVAGPLANIVLGVFLLAAAFGIYGEQRLRAEVGQVLPEFPAAGVLQMGDVIMAADGQPLKGWNEVQAYISERPAQPLMFSVLRGGQMQSIQLVPQAKSHTDIFGDTHTVGRIGVVPSGATETVVRSLGGSVIRAFERTWELTELTVKSLWKLVVGSMDAENLTGPLGIANLTGQTAQVGMYALLVFAALISINLCVVNLVPLPILDGGHLVMLLLEKLRGRPLGPRVQEWAMKAGLACILSLAVFSTWQDIRRLTPAPDAPSSAAPAAGSAATP